MNRTCEPAFGKRLRDERDRLGFSSKDFAEKAGVKRATQYLYETEESSPNYRYFKAIIEMGADIQYLFFNKKSKDEFLQLDLDVLQDIFEAVEYGGRDDRGNLLPYEARREFFKMLCAAYSGRDNFDMEPAMVKKLMIK